MTIKVKCTSPSHKYMYKISNPLTRFWLALPATSQKCWVHPITLVWEMSVHHHQKGLFLLAILKSLFLALTPFVYFFVTQLSEKRARSRG